MLTPEQANEWQDAATWCAKRGLTGKVGDPLPELLSDAVVREIAEYPDEFQAEVRLAAYAEIRLKCTGRI